MNTAVLEKSLYQYIENETGFEIGSAIRKIKADMSDRYEQKYLDCQLFDPVLEIEQVVTFSDGGHLNAILNSLPFTIKVASCIHSI